MLFVCTAAAPLALNEIVVYEKVAMRPARLMTAPLRMNHIICGADVKFQPSTGPLKENGAEVSADVVVRLPAADGVSGVLLACKVFFCQDQDVCLFEEVYFKVPVDKQSSGSAGGEVVLSYALSPKAQTTSFPSLY